MPSEESIRVDASTVHRSGEASPEVEGEIGSLGDSPGSSAEHLAQAKTVIRGSSRIDKAKQRVEMPDRTPAAVAQVLLGQRLNHFLLEKLIGGGGMGAVFRAHDEQLDRTVAIKVIPFVSDDPDLQRRFRNEAQSAAKLDHPRIARVFDVGNHGDWHYIVFEYIEGTNIRDLVNRNGVMSIDEAVFYTSQLAGALQHAADRGIVHRDIKPSNVLIGAEGKIKLVDMGLARSDNIDLSEDMTASGVTLGTFDYISPEQAKDPRDADLRSDIYSLGCTLYFMLTGSPPYPGGTMLQKLLSHGNAPPPNPRELRPEVSDNLSAVLHKMLAKDPADRYQTATDLIADLREVAFRDGLIRSRALSPVAIAPPNPLFAWIEKHTPWIVAAGLLIASAGWLHLESAASRDQLQIPPSAYRPQRSVPLPPASDDLTQPNPNAEANPLPLQPSQQPGAIANPPDEASTFDAPDEPPRLNNLPIPSEATDSTDTSPDTFDEAARTDAPFTMRVPFFDGDDVSVEPLENSIPDVVRLIASDTELESSHDDDGVAIATTLSQAFDLAAEYNVQKIEIATPVIRSEPVKVTSDDLLITSTVGGSMIVFQPMDSVAMERSKMIVIGSHPIEFDDIHFVWNVPSGDVDGGTLFEVNDNELVRLTDCSITVSNPTLRDEVYAFDVITDRDKLRGDRDKLGGEPAEGDQASVFPMIWLELNNVIVRGQMTMLHMDYAAKLSLFWDNGLLAITERMIDTAGAVRQPPPTMGPIFLSLTRVTAHAPQGILRMRVGVSGAYPVPIDRFAIKSVFFVAPATPHFDISGLESLVDETEPLLQLRGASNAYVVDATLADPMLRQTTSTGDTEMTRMNDLLITAPPWANESRPRWSVNWAEASLPDLPTSRRTPADYRQMDVSPPGCDEKSLPAIPDVNWAETRVSTLRTARGNVENRDEL